MLLIFLIVLGGTMLVQMYLRNAYGTWSKKPNAAGLTGREVAEAILRENGVDDVKVEAVRGQLSDHFDPRKNVVRLSEANYGHASVAGMAVAAHEVGHALQHAKGYAPLSWRTALLVPASIGSQWGPWIAIAGLFLNMSGLIQVGVVLFGAAVLFQLVTLPIEFDASRRAHQHLSQMGLVTDRDASGARTVLNAAALTYVAAAAGSVLYLLWFLSMARE